MKITTAMKNEIVFLKSFYTLMKGKMKSTAPQEVVLKNFTVEASKLVKSGQISKDGLDTFLEGMTLDVSVAEAQKAFNFAQAKLLKLQERQTKILSASHDVTVDPCSRGQIRSSC